VLSKLLERLVARQLWDYLSSADLLPPVQSRFRTRHWTETAVLRVLSDILRSVDRDNSAALVLLDLYQQHSTRSTMRFCFSVCELLSASATKVHRRFQSYISWSLVERSMYTASIAQIINSPSDVCMVCASKISVGPLVIYFVHRRSLIEDNGCSPHLYADDTQVYGSCRPVEIVSAKLSEYIGVVSNWMRSKRMQLN